MSPQGTPDRQNVPGELVREFVDHWLALYGDAWLALGGIDDVRRALVEAAAAMVPRSGPGLRRRVVAWSTEELAALDLREILTPQGFEFPAVEDDRAAASNNADGDVAGVATGTAAAADLGITSCAWAAAETGTIALYATPSTGRLTSLLPTAHVALVRPSLIVRTIPEGLALLADHARRQGGFPSTVNLVSGPSRTGDIEGDLAVGAHGPLRAAVIIGDW